MMMFNLNTNQHFGPLNYEHQRLNFDVYTTYIAVGTQPIKLSTSIMVVCRSDFGCMTSPPICDIATTLLKLDYRYSKIHYYIL